MRAELRNALGGAANRLVRAGLLSSSGGGGTIPYALSPASILVVELSRLGDAIQALGAVAALRARFPHARLGLAVDARWAGLFQGQPLLDHVVAVPSGRGPLWRLVRSMGTTGVQLAVNVSPSTRNSLAVFASDAVVRAGYLDLRSSLTPFRDVSLIVRAGHGPLVLRDQPRGLSLPRRADGVLALAGCGAAAIAALRAQEPARALVHRWLEDHDWSPSPLVVVHPGANWRHRTWSARRWARLARGLRSRGHRVVITGASVEASTVAEVMQGAEGARCFVDRPLDELAALIATADLFIGADSGPLHLAAAVGTPVIGLFGPAAPEFTAPASETSRWFHERLECCPCDQRRCVRGADPCVDRVSPWQLIAAARRCLDERPDRRGT